MPSHNYVQQRNDVYGIMWCLSMSTCVRQLGSEFLAVPQDGLFAKQGQSQSKSHAENSVLWFEQHQ